MTLCPLEIWSFPLDFQALKAAITKVIPLSHFHSSVVAVVIVFELLVLTQLRDP